MTIKVELPPGEAQRLVEEWRQRAIQLEGELSELEKAIASVESQMSARLPSAKEVEESSSSSDEPTGKRRKGENLRAIQSYISKLDGKGATVADLAKGTGIGTSSIHLVLKKHVQIFSKGDDGLWRLKEKR